MTPEKAKFYLAGSTDAVVTCQFNPSELTLSKSNNWSPKPAAGKPVPDVTFGGCGARQIQMTLTFDSYEEKRDVTEKTDKLLRLMEVSPGKSGSGKDKRPPHIEFGWGSSARRFPVVITQLSQKFTLFHEDGRPARATVQVTLQEVPPDTAKKRAKGQNPTSHAVGARRVHVVEPGDTLDWIAASELGDPGAWRVLAEANQLDDPRRLRPGQALLIPAEA